MKKLTAKEKAIVREAAAIVLTTPSMGCIALIRAGATPVFCERYLAFYGVRGLPYAWPVEGETFVDVGTERQNARAIALLLFAETGGVL